MGVLAFAEGQLLTTGNAVATETVVLAGRTYTWRASVSTIADEVLVGGTAVQSLQNLLDAINLTGQPGVQYGSLTTVHPHVKAVRIDTSNTLIVRCRVSGAVGNRMSSTETMTNASWSNGSLLTGGVGIITDEINLLITTEQVNASLRQGLLELVNVPAEA